MTFPFVEQDIPVYRGQTLRLPLAFTNVPAIGGISTPVDLTGGTVTMTIAWAAGTWGAAGSIPKSSPASGVTIVSAVGGTASALFSVADLAPVPAGVVARWLVTFTATTGDVMPFGAGYINMKTVP